MRSLSVRSPLEQTSHRRTTVGRRGTDGGPRAESLRSALRRHFGGRRGLRRHVAGAAGGADRGAGLTSPAWMPAPSLVRWSVGLAARQASVRVI